MPFIMSTFKDKTCILHHFSFLVWLQARNFSSPNTSILPLKPHFLTTILPFFAMCFMVRRGFVCTMTLNFYAHPFAFCTILHCILQHFTLRFAPKHTAFCTKTHCILHQNALQLAPKRAAFSGILHYILPQIAQKRVLVAASLNKYSFPLHVQLTSFCIKTNLRENRFFAARCAIGERNGHS